MIIEFEDEDLEELVRSGRNRKYRKVERSKALMSGLSRVIAVMRGVPNVASLKNYSFLKYEKLKHAYSGLSSVRLANGHVERLIFSEHEGGIKVKLIELDETHYGNKK